MGNTARFFTRTIRVGAVIGALLWMFSFPVDTGAHEWEAPQEAAQRVNPVAREQASIDRAAKLFGKFCAACHGKQARGDGPLAGRLKDKPADLVERAKHHPEGDFAWKIANGRGSMPGYKDRLEEDQIWDLINFIKSLKP